MNKKHKKIPLIKLGGLNNSNYLFKLENEKYVLRIPSKDNSNNFYYENEVLSLIKTLNISPEIIYHNKDNGVLISKYIESNKFDINFYNSSTFINSIVNSLHILHNQKSSNYFNPFNEIYKNIKFLLSINFDFDHDINILINKLHNLEKELTKKIQYGLCHNDLNTSNILYCDNLVYLIDFEFSGMGDIFFDLASISWFLEENLRKELITKYFGYYNVELKTKLNNYLFVVKLWNATWSYIKSLNNKSSYDYKLGANMILDDLINNFTF